MIRELIENRLELDTDGVWVSPDAAGFAYSDGLAVEEYLERVFRASSDLSCESTELEQQIKDWPSEYHLTRRRAQLLKAFNYDPSKTVLEVGCGCGAITRFLGETFERVIAIEGSHARARLARLRTRDLENVTIVNSPFQKLRFTAKFDIIFCIGVLEYSSVFVQEKDPHRSILEHFSKLLTPDGVLVVAIENQFGLKYFCSSAEDHTGVLFDGIEGYPRFTGGPRTFGYPELREMMGRHFNHLEFYFPWGDYKVPSCLISERMLGEVDVSELVGTFPSVDHRRRGRRPLFNEQLAWREIARNGMVPWFANSFLVFASKGANSSISADWLGILYTDRRRPEFSAITRFLKGSDGNVDVVKVRADGSEGYVEGKLEHRPWRGPWVRGATLHSEVARLARAQRLTLEEILEPSLAWFQEMADTSREVDGIRMVAGSRLDSLWRNCFVNSGRCEYIDQEWVWRERLPLALLVARALYYFAKSLLDGTNLGPALQGMRVRQFIVRAARIYGLTLTRRDFEELVRFESELLRKVALKDRATSRGRVMAAIDVRLVLRRQLDPVGTQTVRRLALGVARSLKRALRSLRA